MYREERRVQMSLVAMVLGGLCLLPVIGFVLFALWPQRVLVAWLVLGALALLGFALLALRFIQTGTAAKVALSEEALRPGRLYNNERLIEQGQPGSVQGWMGTASWGTLPHVAEVPPPAAFPTQMPPLPLKEGRDLSYEGLRPLSLEEQQYRD